MGRPIFDMEDGDYIFSHFRNVGIDSEGNMMMRVSDNMAMDMASGELHFVSNWSCDDDEK